MNKSLFSKHFLENRLTEQPEWQDDPIAIFAEIHNYWLKAQRLGAKWNEAQTEEEWIKPVLALLGWHYIPQTTTTQGRQTNRPDYALFGDASSKDAAYPLSGQEDAFYSRVLAVAEAKRWERPLSKKESDGRNDAKGNSNPSHQMVAYLVSTRVQWGILTNGVTWRLYSREVSSVASEYYEVDLSTVFAGLDKNQSPSTPQLEQFKRWWLFFRRDAFTVGAQGKSFVQRIHDGSAAYARQVSDKLKEIVFDDVMPEIAGGFVAHRQQQLGFEQESEESLRQIYQASLSLLYKLLFVLYAEARNLLPMANPGYHEQSLQSLAQWAANKRDLQQPLSRSTGTNSTPKYAALLALFERIDGGDPDLSIPRYNGGLFSPNNPDNQFLNRHRLSDYAVAIAIDLLVRDKGEPVDYAYISVRNLGAIYEGLLENKLQVLDAANGKVALINDKGERKASGSYYTPDYIVEYIVQQTLDPILDERYARFDQAMQRCVALRQQLQSKMAENSTTNQLLRRELEKYERLACEAFLGIKVCDPAMGSGHFLVNAVDHLTDGMIQRLQGWHNLNSQIDLTWNPIYNLIERVRHDILQEMKRQQIAVEASKLDDTALLTRLVMKRCVYGVDLNKMAVELAKLSLWLHSFTIGAPLSFLDHHLRWGNSLIGTDVRTVEAALQQTSSGQFNLFAGPFAGLLDLTNVMLQIAEGSDATLADVRQSAEAFQSFQKTLKPYKQVLDLWVSQYFGNKLALEFLTLYGERALPTLRHDEQASPFYEKTLEQSKALYVEKRFFHWDLEFPEVFVDLEHRDWAQNPGFDAVIGNPPYVDIKGLDKDLTKYLFQIYPTAQLRINIFAAFLERALQIIRSKSGEVGVIIPSAFLTQVTYAPLRKYILEDNTFRKLVRLPNELFGDTTGDVKVDTCIIILQKAKSLPEQTTGILIYESFVRISVVSRNTASVIMDVPQERWRNNSDAAIILAKDEESNLISHIQENSQTLEELCEFCLGLTPYDKYSEHTEEQIKQQVFHAKSKFNSSYRKLLKSGDVQPYWVGWNGEDWISYGKWLAAPREQRFFTEERILIQQIIDWSSLRIFAGWTDEELYNTQNQFNLLARQGTDLKFILALLNSKLICYYHRKVFLDIALQRFQKVLIKDAKSFPIRRISFALDVQLRSQFLNQAHQLYNRSIVNKNPTDLLAFTAHHLSQQPAQSDVVHDLLALLAEQMIELNKQKQAEVKGFLKWLQRQIGAEIDTLNGKTTLQNYLGDYQKGEAERTLAEVIDVLLKNKRKLRVDPVSRTFQESVEREYSASLVQLVPIKKQLAFTDRLIDQIVYQLYGLTEEEIAVVEGKK